MNAVLEPRYAFCEAVTATSSSPWHIREVISRLRPSGGVDSPSLCGHVTPGLGGWDLEAKISTGNLVHACPKCAALYLKATTP